MLHTLGSRLRAVCVLPLLALLAGCFAAQDSAIDSISRQLGGPQWALASGEYEVTEDGKTSTMTLIRTILPSGDRVYKTTSAGYYALYGVKGGKVIGASFSEGESGRIAYYTYVEFYNAETLGSYDLKCDDLPPAKKRFWYGTGDEGTCLVTDLSQLLMVLDAASETGVPLRRMFRLAKALPDDI